MAGANTRWHTGTARPDPWQDGLAPPFRFGHNLAVSFLSGRFPDPLAYTLGD